MIKAIVLDLDGPILDGQYRHYQCYSDILSEHGFRPLQIEEYWTLKRNRTNRRELLALSGADVIYEAFHDSWLERIEEQAYLVHDVLQPNISQIFTRWQASGMRLILVTMRNHAVNLHWQLHRHDISKHFSDIVVTGSGHNDPAQLETLKAECLKPIVKHFSEGDMIWIGDTEMDIRAAQSIGVKSCAVSGGLRNERFLASLSPDFLVESLSELDQNLAFNQFMHGDDHGQS